MVSMLDHLPSCLLADSKAWLQTPAFEALGLIFFSFMLANNAHRTRIRIWDRRAFLWGAVDFNSSVEWSNTWSMQRGHTSEAVSPACSDYCLGHLSSKKETKAKDIHAWRWDMWDEARWSFYGIICSNALKFGSRSVCLFPPVLLMVLLQLFAVSSGGAWSVWLLHSSLCPSDSSRYFLHLNWVICYMIRRLSRWMSGFSCPFR